MARGVVTEYENYCDFQMTF